MKRGLTREDWKGLWFILWRMALFGAILLPLGFALLVLVLAFLFVPPGYAVILILDGRILLGIGILVLWGISVWVSRGVLRWIFKGIEYADL